MQIERVGGEVVATTSLGRRNASERFIASCTSALRATDTSVERALLAVASGLGKPRASLARIEAGLSLVAAAHALWSRPQLEEHSLEGDQRTRAIAYFVAAAYAAVRRQRRVRCAFKAWIDRAKLLDDLPMRRATHEPKQPMYTVSALACEVAAVLSAAPSRPWSTFGDVVGRILLCEDEIASRLITLDDHAHDASQPFKRLRGVQSRLAQLLELASAFSPTPEASAFVQVLALRVAGFVLASGAPITT